MPSIRCGTVTYHAFCPANLAARSIGASMSRVSYGSRAVWFVRVRYDLSTGEVGRIVLPRR